MVITSLARSLFVVLLLVAYASEAFIVPTRTPSSYARRSFVRQQQQSTPKSSPSAPSLTPARMSSQYEQGSSESSAGGYSGGSSEMKLQELIVDFTDDGRILLEVKGVKVSTLETRRLKYSRIPTRFVHVRRSELGSQPPGDKSAA